jgi:peptidoglycan hydrolase-like protein with peptidoglycan-binding domain
MTTITETLNGNPATARRTNGTVRRRRREVTRGVALGATIAALAIGGAWAAVGTGGSDHAAQTGAASAPLVASGGSVGVSHSSPTGVSPAYETGPSVAALQRELAQLNYYEGPIDGVAGPMTLAAITNFQRANGLAADGVAGAITMAKIHQQLVTGDSQMWPTAPPVKPSKGTSAHANGQHASAAKGGSISSGGTSPSAVPSGHGTTASGTTASGTTASGTTASGTTASGTTTPSSGGTSVTK